MSKNTTNVLDDIITYASRYGLEALGYALLDMVEHDEIHLTSEQTESLWEYGGKTEVIYSVRLETLNKEGDPIESTDLLETDDYLDAVAYAKKYFEENALEHGQQVIVQDEADPEGILCGFSK